MQPVQVNDQRPSSESWRYGENFLLPTLQLYPTKPEPPGGEWVNKYPTVDDESEFRSNSLAFRMLGSMAGGG